MRGMRGARGLVRATVAIGLMLAAGAGAGRATAAHDLRPAAPAPVRSLQSSEPGKKVGGVVPHFSSVVAARGGARVAAAGGGFDEPPTPGSLSYHGGHVMHTATIRHVFWVPSGYALPASYRTLIDGFMADVAADSGKTSNVFASDTQYTDSSTGHILYSLAFGGSVLITDPFPAGATTNRADCPLVQPTCITDTELEQKLESVAGAQGWPKNTYTNGYAIFTPPGVDVCIDWNGGPFDHPCTYNAFCAYHTWGGVVTSTTPPPIIYAVEPAFTINGWCNDPSFTTPNGDLTTDVTINTLNHEVNEFITDPIPTFYPGFGGWIDGNGYENADKCAYNYGARIGMTAGGALYNQLINGHPYMLQRMWSNAAVPGTGAAGCYSIGAPTITNLSPTSVLIGDDVGITGTNFFFPFGSTPVVKFNGISSPSVTVDSPTHITAEVPTGNAAGKVTVQGTVGGNVVSSQSIGIKPKITGMSVNHGVTGTVVALSGSGFTGVSSVKINGVAGAFSGVTATTLNFTIPSAATTGAITVTTPGGTGPSTDLGGPGPFTVDPKITSFTPTSIAVGGTVTLSGSGFGASGEARTISMGAVTALGSVPRRVSTSITWVSPNSVKFTVPVGAVTNPITITVGSALPFTTAASLKVLPKVTGYAISPAREGDPVTVQGTTLDGATSVKFGVVAAIIDSISSDGTEIHTHVPVNAVTSLVTVVTPGGTSTGPQFKVLPTITGDPAPNDGVAGAHIVLTGRTFTGTSSVKFGDNVQAAPFTIGVGGTTLNVTVPNNATTGKIGVTNAGGVTLTENSFVVHPHVTGFSPTAAGASANVTINGTGFGAVSTVDFTGSAGVIPVSHTATSVLVHVPPDAQFGPLTVTTADGSSISVASFKPLPKITGFGAANYQAGDMVTVNGSNFTANGALTAKLGTNAVTPSSISATSFQFTIPNNGLTAPVTATNLDGTASSPTTLKVRPTITGDPAPNEAMAGAHIVLTGMTFTGTSSVKFNATVSAAFAIGVGGTTLNVTVPNAAVDGLIAVTNAGGTTNTVNPFKVDPKLAAFSPLSAANGANVTITGTGFGSSPTVHFSGSPTAATLGTHSPTSIVAAIPPDAQNGPITVTTVNGDATSVASFKPLMKIGSFGASSYQAGELVTVNGWNFLATGANPTAKLGSIAVVPSSVTATSFQFTIPDNALTASVSATNANGTATSPLTLKVRPTIIGNPAPNEGMAGDHIVLTGKTFTGTTSVKFGNNTQAAPFTIGAGGTTLNVTVPTNATIGKIGVTNAGGLTQTAGDFTIHPRIGSFAPTSGAVGLIVTVNGTGFGSADRVNFGGGVFGVPTNVTATSLKVAVPPGAATGPLTVHTPGGGTSAPSATSFTVTFSVTSISPTAAVYNHDVAITGVGLTGVTAVKFNNVLAPPIASNSGTVIHVNTPSTGSISGTVTIWKGTASIAAPQQFTLMEVTGFLPTSATPGTEVVITGHGFTGATDVKFNGAAATFTVDSSTQITAQVPGGATAGTISVTGPGGTATSSASFTPTSLSAVKINELQTEGTTAHDEFVELFNTADTPANISGCKLIYRTSSGTSDTLVATVPAGTMIPAHGFYLFGGSDYAGTAQQSFTFDLGLLNGSVALRYPSGAIVDLVGYGTLTSGFFEGGAPAPSPPAHESVGRDPAGEDSDQNSLDFQVFAAPTPSLANVVP
jgi:Lamin Tail Domain/IPT/TIG domain